MVLFDHHNVYEQRDDGQLRAAERDQRDDGGAHHRDCHGSHHEQGIFLLAAA